MKAKPDTLKVGLAALAPLAPAGIDAVSAMMRGMQRSELAGSCAQGMFAAFKRWPERSDDMERVAALSVQAADAILAELEKSGGA